MFSIGCAALGAEGGPLLCVPSLAGPPHPLTSPLQLGLPASEYVARYQPLVADITY